MLPFFDDALDVLTAMLFAGFGLFLTIYIANKLHIPRRRALFIYLWHVLFAILFTQITRFGGSDTIGYFYDSQSVDYPFALGTAAIGYLAAIPMTLLDPSYFGMNLFFANISLIGILFVDATVQTAARGTSWTTRMFANLFVFLPSYHFWTASLSKDSLSAFGLGLLIWGMLLPHRRITVICVGMIALLLARPHIAGLILLAMAIGVIFNRQTPYWVRSTSVLLSSVAALFFIPQLLSQLGLSGAFSAVELSEYIVERQIATEYGGSSIDIASLSVLERMVTYLFRPTLLEANGVMGLIVALENLALALLFGVFILKIVRRFRWRAMIPSHVFLLAFGVLSWFILSQTTANLGIAVRQKWMVLPALVVFVLAFLPRTASWQIKVRQDPRRLSSDPVSPRRAGG